ncbi:uncharacterized protein LOC123498903 isoform X1 [Portunus trituberculatus]|uniref:Uncharacterized protein n=1 Tax=Portunus trituberculatus TaxID=210409 RepID=A0A5B7DH70_PORTR|nr:uncharacterized protein LOC123498903 isoform X1 [Portunus trituberculatus]XP_045102375.1 uncharacterized protein LOC123498903 isoform X1 [Portunus trituberculatus]XP_045102376.1 uncharacterized protein LOC123498903 isoform X1 [Portunus trituberculatus]MPC20544.1 hypothetical protein [Portunus trituberculatus]
MLTLKEASRDVLVRWLCSLTMYTSTHAPDANKVYQYLLPATPLQEDLALLCRYYNSPYLTKIFLPTLIAKGKLHITSANMNQIVFYWKDAQVDTSVIPIEYFKVEDIEDGFHFSFLPLLGRMANIKMLVIGCLVSDELLAVLGINCPHLQVFDARDDIGDMVSDVGLAYLAQCRGLKRVFFSAFANEYDLNVEKLGFTGRGVALLLTLPQIVQVTCSEYILRDALHFLYRTRYHKQSLNVQYMLMSDQEVRASTLQILPILCPKLRIVSMYLDTGCERTVGSSLKSLYNLEVLWITTASQCRFQDLSLSNYGPQLTFLGITTCLLRTQDIILMSNCCPQLKILVLRMYSYGFDCTNIDTIQDSLFPSVEKLELIQNISVTLFKILNVKMRNLRELHCARAHINNLEEAVVSILEQGGWNNTELLTLPMDYPISLDVAQLVASKSPSLKFMAVDLQSRQEKKLYRFLQNSVPGVKLLDYYPDLSPSKTGVFSDSVWLKRM